MKLWRLGVVVFSIFLAGVTALAQGSGHVGGGKRKELELKRMLFDLALYLDSAEGQRNFPEIVAYDRRHPEETFSELTRSVSLVFKPGAVRDGFNGERDCVSRFGDSLRRVIECNDSAPLDPSDLNAQPGLYAFLFHEVLVQAELERPVSADLPSVYPISSRLKFHREVYEKMIPGEVLDPLSSPRLVRFVVVNGAQLGARSPVVLAIDLDRGEAKLLMDSFLGDTAYAMSAAIEVLPWNRCIVLANGSHGRQSLYCDDVIRGTPTGLFRRQGNDSGPGDFGAQFKLASLEPQAEARTASRLGGVFRMEGADRRAVIDPVISLLRIYPRCEPQKDAFSQYFRFHGADSTELGVQGFDFAGREGFEFSMGKGRIVSCVYLDADHVSCDGHSWTRVDAASEVGACPAPSHPDPSYWSNAVVAPDGNLWTGVIGLYQNCLGNGDGQTGHYVDTLCSLDSNDSFAGQVDSSGTILESDAVAACERIGGRLPTLQEYEALPADARYWPEVDEPSWKPVQFWTSTLNPTGVGPRSAYGDPNVPNGRSAYVFVMYGEDSCKFGKVAPDYQRAWVGAIATDNRNWINYVRCVRN